MRYIFVFLFFCSFTGSYAQVQCLDYKYGHYICTTPIKRGHNETVYRPNDSMQYLYSAVAGFKDTSLFKLMWVNDCNYVLKYVQSSHPKFHPSMKTGDVIYVHVDSISVDSTIYITSLFRGYKNRDRYKKR